MSDDIFKVIEEVLKDRVGSGEKYSIRSATYDIFKLADQQQPGVTMATRDVRAILKKLGRTHTLSAISRTIGELHDDDMIAFAGKEERKGITTHRVPVFRLVNDEA